MKRYSIMLLGVVMLGGSPVDSAFAQTPAPGFTAVPDDIDCPVQGMSFMSTVGPGGALQQTDGSANAVTCWMSGNQPGPKKAIPLASTKIKNGMLPTKDFGDLQITPVNSLTSGGLYMAIRAEMVQPLRAYLQAK